VRGYCWDSPASLYTFRKTIALSGLARDCLFDKEFPRVHPVIHSPLLEKAPKISGQRSTDELARHYQTRSLV
jgi:hypothetical protein